MGNRDIKVYGIIQGIRATRLALGILGHQYLLVASVNIMMSFLITLNTYPFAFIDGQSFPHSAASGRPSSP